MPYTVWSRGRLIGETDLEFVRIMPDMRAGWFRPASDVAMEMPDMSVPTPAMLAFMRRDRAEVDAGRDDPAAIRATTLFADMAESLQRHEELELELRDADGRVVPTANVAIQDCERLRQLAAEDYPAWDPHEDEVPFMLELVDSDAEVMHDLDLASGWWDDIEMESGLEPSSHDEDPRPDERYQVYVHLTEPDSIP